MAEKSYELNFLYGTSTEILNQKYLLFFVQKTFLNSF